MKVAVVKTVNYAFDNGKNKTKIVAKVGFKKAGGTSTSGWGSYTEEDKTWNGYVNFNLWGKASLAEDKFPGEGDIIDIPVHQLYSFKKQDWTGDDGKERFSIDLTLSSQPKGWEEKLASYMCDFNPDWERS